MLGEQSSWEKCFLDKKPEDLIESKLRGSRHANATRQALITTADCPKFLILNHHPPGTLLVLAKFP